MKAIGSILFMYFIDHPTKSSYCNLLYSSSWVSAGEPKRNSVVPLAEAILFVIVKRTSVTRTYESHERGRRLDYCPWIKVTKNINIRR